MKERERGGGKKNPLLNTALKTTNRATLMTLTPPALLYTLSLVALTLEPRPTPIKHLKAFMFPLPQINNIQHP